jgi:hypothetical protein
MEEKGGLVIGSNKMSVPSSSQTILEAFLFKAYGTPDERAKARRWQNLIIDIMLRDLIASFVYA